MFDKYVSRLNLILLSVGILLGAAFAFARTGDPVTNTTWSDWQNLGALTNCDGDSINSAVICGDTAGFKTEGYNALTLEIFYTRSAGDGYEFYLETCSEGQTDSDCNDAGDWSRVALQKSTSGTGTELSGDPFFYDTNASSALTYTITINYRRVRLAGFVSTGTPDAGDVITVLGTLTKVNAI